MARLTRWFRATRIEVSNSELFPTFEVHEHCFVLFQIGRDFVIRMFAKVRNCDIDSCSHHELTVEPASGIHVDLFALPHEGNVRWVSDQIEQQAAPLDLLETIRLAFSFW
jgi:hypothetical protein